MLSFGLGFFLLVGQSEPILLYEGDLSSRRERLGKYRVEIDPTREVALNNEQVTNKTELPIRVYISSGIPRPFREITVKEFRIERSGERASIQLDIQDGQLHIAMELGWIYPTGRPLPIARARMAHLPKTLPNALVEIPYNLKLERLEDWLRQALGGCATSLPKATTH